MLKVNVERPIASVILDRPDIHNAFNDELVKLVTETFTELGARDDVRVIVLGGNGKSFCAGADLNWMKRMVQYTREQNLEDVLDHRQMSQAGHRARSRCGVRRWSRIGGGV